MRRLLLAAVLAALPFCAHAQVIGPTGVTVVGDTSSNLVSGPYKLLFNGATVSNAGNGVAEITFTNDGTGCVPSGGAPTNIMLYGVAGACAPAPDANVTLGALSLGVDASVGGTLNLFGSTSGEASLNGGTTGVFTSASNWALTGYSIRLRQPLLLSSRVILRNLRLLPTPCCKSLARTPLVAGC